jgi:hypothetical protein
LSRAITGRQHLVDRGLKNSHPRYKKLQPGDWVEWLIVALLFAVSSVGVFVLTGSLLSALFVGVLVWVVAVGVVAIL